MTALRRLCPLVALVALVSLPGLAAPARGAVVRHAVIIGANVGDPGDVPLRYAEADARRMGEILQRVGGFGPERVQRVLGGTAGDVRAALDAAERRIVREGGDALLLVFYSGHADVEALHLRGTHLPWAEMRDRVARSKASVRLMIADACRSGAVTRVKGGRPGPAFRIDLDDQMSAQGFAILTSSAAGEDSQESEAFEASVFTHYLASALLGAADSDGDGRVTLGESFGWASDRTLAATASSIPGPQHPTFEMALGGRGDLVVTFPRSVEAGLGAIVLEAPGTAIVRTATGSRTVLGELTVSDAPRTIAVPPGRYVVSHRGPGGVREARAVVAAGAATRIADADLRAVVPTQRTTKGSVRGAVYAGASLRGEILDLGLAPGGHVGVTTWLGPWELGLRLEAAGAATRAGGVTASTYEVGAVASGGYAIGLGPTLLTPALELGWAWLGQRFSPDAPARDASAPSVGLGLTLRVPIAGAFRARLDGAGRLLVLRSGRDPSAAHVEAPVTFRVGAGLEAVW